MNTYYSSDASGNRATRNRADGGSERFRHDVQGKVTQRTDALDRTWHVRWDAHGHLLSEHDSLGRSKQQPVQLRRRPEIT